MTATIPKPPYARAPIIECVIHLSVTGNVGTDQLEKLAKRFAKNYPQQESLNTINVNINTTGGPATVEQHPQGYKVRSIDEADVLLLLPDGVVASRLAPYPGWEYLRERAELVWGERRSKIGYSPLKRIGVRYINRIDIPIKQAEIIDMENYMLFSPRVCQRRSNFLPVRRSKTRPNWMMMTQA